MKLLLALLLVVQGQGSRVIASTNDWKITQDQYDAILKTFPETDRLRYLDSEYRRGLVNELVKIWVLCAEARKNGVIILDNYQSQKAYYQSYAQQIDDTIGEQAVRAYYDAHID